MDETTLWRRRAEFFSSQLPRPNDWSDVDARIHEGLEKVAVLTASLKEPLFLVKNFIGALEDLECSFASATDIRNCMDEALVMDEQETFTCYQEDGHMYWFSNNTGWFYYQPENAWTEEILISRKPIVKDSE